MKRICNREINPVSLLKSPNSPRSQEPQRSSGMAGDRVTGAPPACSTPQASTRANKVENLSLEQADEQGRSNDPAEKKKLTATDDAKKTAHHRTGALHRDVWGSTRVSHWEANPSAGAGIAFFPLADSQTTGLERPLSMHSGLYRGVVVIDRAPV